MNIVVFHKQEENERLKRFTEQVEDMEKVYLASNLLSCGFEDMLKVKQAIDRTIALLESIAFPRRPHISAIYFSDNGQLVCDWKLSALGWELVLINGEPTNPFVAEAQLKLWHTYNTTRVS